MISEQHTVQARVRTVVISLIILFVGLLALSIPSQRVHIDEAWLGEQAHWQATDGVRRSELFHGFLDYENYIYVAHKGFIWLGAISVGLFGWHLWALRLIPLLSGVFLLTLLWIYFRRARDEEAPPAFTVAVLFLVAAPLSFRFVNLYRPELPLAVVGFASFLFMATYVRTQRMAFLAASGAFAGLGVVIHLNGVIYIAAGALTLLWLRRWRGLAAFVPIAAVVASVYFYDVFGHWEAFWYQFRADPALDKNDFAWYSPVWRLANEHKRLFRKPEVIFASLLLIASLWYYWKSMPREKRWITVYAIGLVVGLGAFAQGKVVAYTILHLPVAAVIIATATTDWLSNRRQSNRKISIAAFALWLLFLGHAVFDDARFATTSKRDVAATNSEAAQYIPHGATVLAPLDFIFEEIQNYRVRGDEAAAWKIKMSRTDIGDIHKSIHAPDFLNYADQHGIEAVVLEDYLFTRIGMESPSVGDTVNGYIVAGKCQKPARSVLLK